MRLRVLAAIAAAAVVTPVASAQSLVISNHGIPKHPSKFCFHNFIGAKEGEGLKVGKKCIHYVYEPARKHVFTLEPTSGGGTVIGHYSIPCEKDVCPEVSYR